MPGTPARQAAERIVRTLRDRGHVAYFAGGCVRDELLNLVPSDYDVATDATPDRVQSLFPRSGEVGKCFGVVLVKIAGEVIEVATFRSDGDYSDKRRPDTVHFSNPEEDARRRDFTVNALFLDPFGIPAPHSPRPALGGAVIDHVRGLPDLDARLLRAVGNPDQRLDEDHLRALRGARLAAKLGFQIEPATALAIRRHASQLQGVSRERIGDEVRRMLDHSSRGLAARLITDLDLQAPVFLQPASTSPLPPGPPARLAALPPDTDAPTALAAWALDLGAPLDDPSLAELLARWRKALCLSNDEREALATTLRSVAVLRGPWRSLPIARQKRLAASPGFAGALSIFTAEDRRAGGEARHRVQELSRSFGGLNPPPLLTGDHLVASGLSPGPRFKTILDAVYDAQLEGRISNIDQARELAARLGV
ncbi:CCA-adding enzyme [Phycisphaerales bacterium]|nr:CCA-adding enzyme [Phycisphaerales bacterium]